MSRWLPLALIVMAAVSDAARAGDSAAERRARMLLQIEQLSRSLSQDRELLKTADAEVEQRRGEYEGALAASRRAGDRYAKAKRDFEEAQRHETQLFRTLKDRLKTDPQVVAAREELVAAQKALDEERERVLAPVRLTAEHRKATAALEKARSQIEQARAEGKASPQELATMAGKSLELSHTVAAIEKEALAPDEEHSKAQGRVKEARAALGELNRQIADQIRVDPERIAAVDSVRQTKEQAAKADRVSEQAQRRLTLTKRLYAQADATATAIARRMAATEQLLRRHEIELSLGLRR